MLVLSRRANQSILFPSLNITIKVIDNKGSNVRLGIECPRDIQIIRDELINPLEQMLAKQEGEAQNSQWSHAMRGRLNSAVMGLYVVEKQLEAGMVEEAEATLRDALKLLESLDGEIAFQGKKQPSKKPQQIHALLVEDDLNEEALLSSYLRLSGFDVQTAHDGYEAMEFLSSHDHPDFILLDMRLPHFDGPKTIAAIRNNPAYNHVRIFGVSGSSNDEFNAMPEKAMVDRWFQKPLNPARIAEAMKVAMCN